MFFVISSKVSIFHQIQPIYRVSSKLFTPAFKSKFCQMQKMVLHLEIDLELAEKFNLKMATFILE